MLPDAFAEPLLDFSDLKRLNVVKTHSRLQTLIRDRGFPKGIWTGPNSHRWTPQSVRDWLANLPTSQPPLVRARAAKSAAKRRARRAEESRTEASIVDGMPDDGSIPAFMLRKGGLS